MNETSIAPINIPDAQRPRKIYVASSWRNEFQPTVVNALGASGHQVYDFKRPRPGDNGFSWRDIDSVGDWNCVHVFASIARSCKEFKPIEKIRQ